jgi:hypothetical protein
MSSTLGRKVRIPMAVLVANADPHRAFHLKGGISVKVWLTEVTDVVPATISRRAQADLA